MEFDFVYKCSTQGEIAYEALQRFREADDAGEYALLVPRTGQSNLPNYKQLEIPGLQLCTPLKGDSMFAITSRSSRHHAAHATEPYPFSLYLTVDFDNQMVRYLRPILQHKLIEGQPQLAYFYYRLLELFEQGTFNSFSCHPFLFEDLVMQARTEESNPLGKSGPPWTGQGGPRNFAVFQEYTAMTSQDYYKTGLPGGELAEEDVEQIVARHCDEYLRARETAKELVQTGSLNFTHAQRVSVAYLLRACRIYVRRIAGSTANGTAGSIIGDDDAFLQLCDILNRRIPLLEQELVIAFFLASDNDITRSFFKKITKPLKALMNDPSSADALTTFSHALNNTAWDLCHIRLLALLNSFDRKSEPMRAVREAAQAEFIPFHVLATLDKDLQSVFSAIEYKALALYPNGNSVPFLEDGLFSLASRYDVGEQFCAIAEARRAKSAGYTQAADVESAIEQEKNQLLINLGVTGAAHAPH